jgi:protein-glutamine gamma-glutamyltransferase
LSSGEIRRSLEKTDATPRGPQAGFHARLAIVSVLATLGILVITGGFFFLLPRTAEAAFARFVSHRPYLLPGFSNQVTLGQIGEIKTNSQAVMHIAIFSRGVLPAIKWRGAALNEFDGKRWSNRDPREERIPVRNGHVQLETGSQGRRLNYHVQLSAADTDALFFAGKPVNLDLSQFLVIRNATGSYRLARVPPPGFSYDAYSVLDEQPEVSLPLTPAPVLPERTRRETLQLPKLDPRISDLARTFTAGSTTDLEKARALERRLRHDYAYSLALPDREVPDPLADFLFVRRKGYCEHFASAMTIMLRTLGVPARLVTGFQSGTYNPISDLWVVRASDAHSWVEAWIPQHGWATFDPTPPDPNPPGFALLSRLELYVDAAQTFWQDWVVSYDLRRQGTLSYRMEDGARALGLRWFDSLTDLRTDWPSRILARLRRSGIRVWVLLLALAVSTWLLAPRFLRVARMWTGVRRVRRGEAARGDATLLYERMLDVLQRRGYEKPPWFTPTEFAAALPSHGIGATVNEFTAYYHQWRFGGRVEASRRLSEILEELERAPL